jgi:hypothetical protein
MTKEPNLIGSLIFFKSTTIIQPSSWFNYKTKGVMSGNSAHMAVMSHMDILTDRTTN